LSTNDIVVVPVDQIDGKGVFLDSVWVEKKCDRPTYDVASSNMHLESKQGNDRTFMLSLDTTLTSKAGNDCVEEEDKHDSDVSDSLGTKFEQSFDVKRCDQTIPKLPSKSKQVSDKDM
jgi:hypothetical protein